MRVDERPAQSPTATRAAGGSAAAAVWILLATLGLVAGYLVRLWGAPDDDLWLHARIGEALRDGIRFQVVPDPLVVVADLPYVPTQWLSEVSTSWVLDVAGLEGIRVVRALCVAALLALAYVTARTWAGVVAAASISLVTALTTSAAWAERPQLVGLALAAVTVLLWSRTLRDGRPQWWLVPLTWLWAMVHGSWAVGLAIGGLMVLALALDRPGPDVRWSRLGALLGACLVVPALTPLGPALWVQPFAVNAAARATVNEWQSPAPTNPLLVAVVLAALVAVVRSVRRRPVDLPALLMAVGAVALSAYAVRTIALGALLLVPALARAFRSPAPWPLRRAELVPAAVAAVVFLAVPGVVWATDTTRPLGPGVETALSALPEGTAAGVDVRVSGWVLWAHPGLRPARDLRAEIYSADAAAAYESFSRGEPGWERYAAEHGIRVALTDTGGPLAAALASSGRWEQRATDGTWVLWTQPGVGGAAG